MSPHRPNPETAAVLRDALSAWANAEEAAAAWLSDCGHDALLPFARQLRRDFRAWYTTGVDDLATQMIRLALSRVDWKYVAGRLLDRAARRRLKTDTNDLLRLLRERGRRLP